VQIGVEGSVVKLTIRKTGRFTFKMHKLDIIVQARNSRFAGTFLHFVGTNVPVDTLN